MEHIPGDRTPRNWLFQLLTKPMPIARYRPVLRQAIVPWGAIALILSLSTPSLANSGDLDLLGEMTKLELKDFEISQVSFSDGELAAYVRAAVEIERARRQTYEQISRDNNGSVPDIDCSNPASMSNLGGNVRNQAQGFCNSSMQIISRHGLTPAQFNQISISRQTNRELNNRIRSILQQQMQR